jgi:LuxR family maltose regulon positive regulatory protein
MGTAADDAALAHLLESTEGWPVGLYLAGLTVKAGSGWRGANRSGADGDDMRTYLRAEILEQISDAELAFLTRSSVLARLCGPLCDATVGDTGSARLLEQLERRNLLVVPLDRRREWYRYHHLFREMLTEELRRREPQLVPQLHARAAAWFEKNGLADEAIEHAQKAGEPDLVARLVLEHMQPVWASGRVDTVLRWTTWLDREGRLHRYPGIAIHGALIFALLGRVEQAEAWATVARTAPTDVQLPDGNTTGSLLAYLRAILAQDGVEAMRADARASFAELAPSSPYRVTMLFTEGMSYLLEGDLDRADPILALAREDAERVGTLPLAAMILAERCIVAERRSDSARAESLARQALAIVEAGGFEDYWTSALVYACAARAALARGEVREARLYASHCTRLRPLLAYSIPVAPVQALLELSRVYLGLGDAGGAEAALHQAEEILAERPRLGVLRDEARDLRGTLDRVAAEPDGASSLTAAELRLLPLLATHLSLGQIGERLHVARATVKAQTTSIYRKLRVSSRRDAVNRSRELGLDVR